MYVEGQGVSKNPPQGATWLRKAADQGQAEAEAKLGTMYMEGQGVPEDYAEALSWSGKAADQGNADAQHTLGILYATGHGVEKDFVRAHMWFNLSAAGGNPLAVTDRQFIQAKMTPEQVAEAQHMALVFKPGSASQSPDPAVVTPKLTNAAPGAAPPAIVATPAPEKAANLPKAEATPQAHSPAGDTPAPVASSPKATPAPTPSPKQMLEKAADLPIDPQLSAPARVPVNVAPNSAVSPPTPTATPSPKKIPEKAADLPVKPEPSPSISKEHRSHPGRFASDRRAVDAQTPGKGGRFAAAAGCPGDDASVARYTGDAAERSDPSGGGASDVESHPNSEEQAGKGRQVAERTG